MSAAIQLVNQVTKEIDRFEMPADVTFNNVAVFESAPEQRLRRATSQIGQLQAEVATLRDELTRAERTIAQYEQLLRNAMVREQELRAEMVKTMF